MGAVTDSLLANMEIHGIPEGMRDGLLLYLEHGFFPGSFLMAVLSNDLKEAVARGDEDNLEQARELRALSSQPRTRDGVGLTGHGRSVGGAVSSRKEPPMKLPTAGHSLDLVPVTEASIDAAKVYNNEEQDKLRFLRLVDLYGLERVERWLANVKRDVSPGTIADPTPISLLNVCPAADPG